MIYAGNSVAAEADEGGTLTLGYTWGFGADNLVAVHRYDPSGHWYVVPDQLHSVRGLRRRDGPSVLSLRYRIYGAVLDSSGTAPFALRYRWTGREYDAETGFYYFRARYYDPQSQRFVQEDPIGYAGGAVLYGYAGGNPVMGRDPSGLAAENPMDFGGECMTGTLSACSHHSDVLGDVGGGGGGGGWQDELEGWLAGVALEAAILTSYEQYQAAFKALKDQGVLGAIARAFSDVDPSLASELGPDDFRAVQWGLVQIYQARGLDRNGASLFRENAVVAGGLGGLLTVGRIALYNSPEGIGSSTWERPGGGGSSFIFLHPQWVHLGRPYNTLVEEWYHIYYRTSDDRPKVRPACIRVLRQC